MKQFKADLRTLDISDLMMGLSITGFVCSFAVWLLILAEKLPVDLQ